MNWRTIALLLLLIICLVGLSILMQWQRTGVLPQFHPIEGGGKSTVTPQEKPSTPAKEGHSKVPMPGPGFR